MFCTNCGSQQPDQAAFCSSCGVNIAAKFPTAAAGQPAPVATNFAQPVQGTYQAAGYAQNGFSQAGYQRPPKSKTAAVLLAVFLGSWAWLYTYKFDAAKFWIAMGSSVLLFVLNFVLPGLGILGLGFTIWAIVDAASRTDQWYFTYWNRSV